MTRFATRCPNCGGPIAFAWSQSVQTVCEHCRSVVVRHDVDVRALGQAATVPPDVSPIQLGTRGRFENSAFEVVGRIVYAYEDGGWNEWHIVFDGGRSGWLSDAQADYAVSVQTTPDRALPTADKVKAGLTVRAQERDFVATTITKARYAAVEGELPFVTWDREYATFADLKTTSGDFATIDYTEDPPLLFVGRQVDFDALGLSNLRDLKASIGEAAVSGFNCVSCGGAIALRAGQHTTTVACPSCGTIVNPRDPNFKVVQAASERQEHQPRIPLGTRGQFDGKTWDAVGFQYRTITVDGTDYGWDEYVLFNPYYGFRYLSEYQGHWNVIRPITGLPEGDRIGKPEFGGRTYQRFQRALATTRVVYGEFPWTVRAGDRVESIDFVAPPSLLSNEREDDDESWSVGTYTPGAEIWKAFSLEGQPPNAIGVFANQPSPYEGRPGKYWRFFGILALLWLGLVAFRFASADRKVVFASTYTFTKGAANAFVTPEFEIPGGVSTVEVAARSNSIANDWLSLAMALVNVETGEAYDFGDEIEYYAGVEDGESWTEGSREASVMLPTVPAGRYMLRIEPAGAERQPRIDYEVRLRRDVPRISYLLVVLGLLAIPPIMATLSAAGFERRRWAESGDVDDEGRSAGGDDEDDDSSDSDDSSDDD